MTDLAEDATNPEEEVAQKPSDVVEADDQSEQPVEDSDQGESPDTADDLEDVELDGMQYKLPKAVASKVMMHADYTQKTQTLAEERARYDEERESFNRQQEATGALMGDLQRLHALDWQIAELNGIDFEALNQQDPDRARSLWFRRERLMGERGETVQGLNQKNQARLAAEAETFEKARNQAIAILNRPDPAMGWDKGGLTPERQQRLIDVGKKLGYHDSEIQRIIDPRLIKALNLIDVGLATLEKQRAATAKSPAQVSPAAQVGKSGMKTPSRKSLSDDSVKDDKEWLRLRREQLERKGR